MITPRRARALAAGLAVCSAGCNYAVYNNQDVRDAFGKIGGIYKGALDKANNETVKCIGDEKKVLEIYAADTEQTKVFLGRVNIFMRNRALLNNPIEKEEDMKAVAAAVISAVGRSFWGIPKSEETMLGLYDWVTINIGVDREKEDLTSPSETLSKRFANQTSRLLLLYAMLDAEFPHSARIVEAHYGGKASASLEFNLNMVQGMPREAPKAEEALARAVSKRYSIPLPDALKLMKGAVKPDAFGLWLKIDPAKGRESGLGGKMDNELKIAVHDFSDWG